MKKSEIRLSEFCPISGEWGELGILNGMNVSHKILPNTTKCQGIWRLGRVRDTKFGMNVSNKMLPNASKCQGYSFYRF